MRRLVRQCGGKRVPTWTAYLRALRRRAAIADWLQGYAYVEIALKYGLSQSYTRRLITEHLRRRQQAAQNVLS